MTEPLLSNPVNIHLLTPCPVCGLESECPHTPMRCRHEWDYSAFPEKPGVTRTCGYCGRIERAAIKWETVRE